MLHGHCHGRIVDRHHCLSVLRTLYQSAGMLLQSMCDQIHVSYVSCEDETLLSAGEISMLSRPIVPSQLFLGVTSNSKTFAIAS